MEAVVVRPLPVEGVDVLLDPEQGGALIQEAQVANTLLLLFGGIYK
jgi:hypothetical protein